MSLSQTCSRPAAADAVFAPEPIRPLDVPESAAAWSGARAHLLAAWQDVIGAPAFGTSAFGDVDRRPERVDTFEQPTYDAEVWHQPTTPTSRQTLLLMRPKRPLADPCPGMVVPFYHPDRMAGIDLQTREPWPDDPPVIHFGRHLASLGFTVVCSEAYPYNTVPDAASHEGMSVWRAAAERLAADHPTWSGVGRLAWDASRALDLLLDQPDVDADRCGVMGHSLGGKISFYAAALDERFAACIASDFGIGWRFTNWDDDWYLGDRIHQPGFERAHHELLALMAPRPFFLVGGEADRPASWAYLQEAQRVYDLFGRREAVGFYHHGAGHRPTEASMRAAYGWLGEQVGVDIDPEAVDL
jgi:hypothetical protein